MPKQQTALLAFNRGRISPLGLARLDLKRVQLSADLQTNWMPRVLGSMMLRPGFEHIGGTQNFAKVKYLDFIYANDDTALIEIGEESIRIWIEDELLERPAVTATVTNGNFATDISGWTDADESGATSSWHSSGYMQLVGTGELAAIRRQEVTVNEPDVEHGLRILIRRGPVTLKVGSTSGDDDYVAETSLGTGEHSIHFTPTGNFHIEFSSRRIAASLVEDVAVESAGPVALTSPYLVTDLPFLRKDQSADVVFLACDGVQQHKIERRGQRPHARSWSIVRYETEDGPFRNPNVTPITLAASGIVGDITLMASAPLFKSTHVGALFQITSTGQTVQKSVSAENTFSDPIRITGVGNNRAFAYIVGGTFSGTWTLQQSVGEEGNWQDTAITGTGTISTSLTDGLDNQIVFYRIGVKTGNFSSGTFEMQLQYSFGSITGVARITGYTSRTVATAAVMKALGNTAATDEWAEGAWSDERGWPSAVALHEGRLVWAGKDKVWASVSDAFDSFDPDTEGDSGPLSRSIGSGPVDRVSWLLSVARLLMGGQGAEFSVRSSALDEPLTPTNFAIKKASTLGSAAVPGVLVDSRAIFVEQTSHVHELAFASDVNEFTPTDLTQLFPEMGDEGVNAIAVQRKPDTRIHCVRGDGTAAVLIFDQRENVISWIEIETDGEIEDVATLPGTKETGVYYSVKRTINGSDVRYLEKWALESECQGGTLNKQADSFTVFENASPSATVTGLSHLEGKDVVAWADGKCLRDEDGEIETFTVSGGQISLTQEGAAYLATTGVVGLPYMGRYRSTKLALAQGDGGQSLFANKKIDQLGLILHNTHAKGIKYGPDFDNMDEMPEREGDALVDPDTIHEHYHEPMMEFNGAWTTDSRLCLEANAPRPVTVLAAGMTNAVNL